MFYQFDDEIETIELEKINPHLISAGYVTSTQANDILSSLGFRRDADLPKGSGIQIEAHDDYIDLSLKLIHGDEIGIIASKSRLIIIDLFDNDSSTLAFFMSTLKRYSAEKATVPRLLSAFFDMILNDNFKSIEDTGFKITELEEDILNEKANNEFSIEILKIKKALLSFLAFYNQLLSAEEVLIDEANELFACDAKSLEALHLRTERIKADINALQGAVVHLQETYSAYLDLKLNQTMKAFTVITSIFFPLTVIASWYGMNFRFMPELNWRYGYPFVIGLCVIIISALMIIGKRKKWL